MKMPSDDEDNDIVPDHLLPQHLRSKKEVQPQEDSNDLVPDHLLPPGLSQMRVEPTTKDLIPYLSGAVKDMYYADISRDVPHDIALQRVYDTTVGKMQIQQAIDKISSSNINKIGA